MFISVTFNNFKKMTWKELHFGGEKLTEKNLAVDIPQTHFHIETRYLFGGRAQIHLRYHVDYEKSFETKVLIEDFNNPKDLYMRLNEITEEVERITESFDGE